MLQSLKMNILSLNMKLQSAKIGALMPINSPLTSGLKYAPV